jgi:hypothetical protein
VSARHGSRRAQALGDGVRRAALLGLLVQVPDATAGIIGFMRAYPPMSLAWPYVIDTLQLAASVTAGVAVVAVIIGRRLLAQASCGIAVATSVAGVAFAHELHSGQVNASVFISTWVAVTCLVVGFPPEILPPARSPWLLAAAGAALLGVASTVAQELLVAWHPLPDDGALSLLYFFEPGWAVIAAAAMLPLLRHRLRVGAWATALAITAAAMLPARLRWLAATRGIAVAEAHRSPLVVVIAVQLIGLATVAVVTAYVGVRDYRRLPVPTAAS